jgi:sulfur-oxidizing protein SoxX
MKNLKKLTTFGALLASSTLLVACAGEEKMSPTAAKYTSMTPEALAEYLIFETNSFKLDQKMQEGGTGRDRLTQDELQKTCTSFRGKPTDSETIQKISTAARETIQYPEGGIQLGDWKKGRELAWSGFGYRVGHRNDDHSARGPGANCYNCHQLATDRTGGTIGPSLTGYGKIRGTSDAMLKYAYEVLYNPHTYFPCTNMPRMGANGMLNQEQISDILAYLFDPESPVNE